MQKKPKLRIGPDEEGRLRIFLLAGNGSELFRSVPAVKRGNLERTLDRIRKAFAEAELEPGPRQATQAPE